MSVLDELRYWLIKLVVGKRLVVMNAELRGSVHIKKNQRGGLIANCVFHEPEPRPEGGYR